MQEVGKSVFLKTVSIQKRHSSLRLTFYFPGLCGPKGIRFTYMWIFFNSKYYCTVPVLKLLKSAESRNGGFKRLSVNYRQMNTCVVEGSAVCYLNGIE